MFALNSFALPIKQLPQRQSSTFTTPSTTITLPPHIFITSRIIEGSEIAYDVHQGTRHGSVHMTSSNSQKGRTDHAMSGS